MELRAAYSTVVVARHSQKIESDIRRGWSAWMGGWEKSPADFYIIGRDGEYVDTDDLSDDEIVEIAEENGFEIRFDTETGMWAHWHHDGLSCFALNAETLADAMTELEARFITNRAVSFDRGDVTVGTVTLAHSVGDWHILECADTYPES